MENANKTLWPWKYVWPIDDFGQWYIVNAFCMNNTSLSTNQKKKNNPFTKKKNTAYSIVFRFVHFHSCCRHQVVVLANEGHKQNNFLYYMQVQMVFLVLLLLPLLSPQMLLLLLIKSLAIIDMANCLYLRINRVE